MEELIQDIEDKESAKRKEHYQNLIQTYLILSTSYLIISNVIQHYPTLSNIISYYLQLHNESLSYSKYFSSDSRSHNPFKHPNHFSPWIQPCPFPYINKLCCKYQGVERLCHAYHSSIEVVGIFKVLSIFVLSFNVYFRLFFNYDEHV